MQADNLARKLEGRFRTALNERVAFWSTAFGQARSAQQQSDSSRTSTPRDRGQQHHDIQRAATTRR